MIASAFESHGLAVEKKSFVGVPRQTADAEADALRIACLSTGLDGYHCRIKIRRLRGPKRWIRQIRVRHESSRAVCRNRLGSGLRGGYDFSCGIVNLPAYPATLRLLVLVLHDCAQTQGGRGAAFHGGANIAVPISEMKGVRLGQPHMPVDSRALVKPAVAKAGVHTHYEIILAAIIEKIRHVEAEGRITVVIASHERSV